MDITNLDSNINDEKIIQYVESNNMNPEFGKILREIIFIMNNTFGSDNWEMLRHKDSEFNSMAINIKFDVIRISNSDNKSHIIRDLYVTFRVEYRTVDEKPAIRISNIYGGRGTVTESEYNSGYAHSHLSSNTTSSMSYGNYLDTNNVAAASDFCLGSGEVSKLLGMIRSLPWDAGVFRFFLYHLDLYVRWESLEGGPYHRIEGMTHGKFKYEPTPLSNDEKQEIRNIIDKTITRDVFELSLQDSVVCINDDDEKFVTYLMNVLPHKYLVEKSISGKLYNISAVADEETLSNKHRRYVPIVWKGTPLGRLKVIKSSGGESNKIENVWLRPEVIQEAKSYVNSLIQNLIIYGHN